MLDIAHGTLVTYNPKAVTPETTLDELQQIMQQLQVRHLPVVDEEHVIVGLVSERDLARAQYNEMITSGGGPAKSAGGKRVEQIMARQVMTLERFESPEIALRAMVAHAFHSVPITEDGHLVGMITSSDFLREFSYGDWAGHDEPVRCRMGAPGIRSMLNCRWSKCWTSRKNIRRNSLSSCGAIGRWGFFPARHFGNVCTAAATSRKLPISVPLPCACFCRCCQRSPQNYRWVRPRAECLNIEHAHCRWSIALECCWASCKKTTFYGRWSNDWKNSRRRRTMAE